jgi:hypothetical protein
MQVRHVYFRLGCAVAVGAIFKDTHLFCGIVIRLLHCVRQASKHIH